MINGKWALTDVDQDRLTAQGLARGLADAGWHDVLGLKDFLSDPVAGLNGLQHIVTDPATRTQLGEAIYQELNAKIERMQTVVTVGGSQNAEQLGRDLGELVWQVGSIATGVGGTAKGGAALAKVGIDVGSKGLEAMAGLAREGKLGSSIVGNAADGARIGHGLLGGNSETQISNVVLEERRVGYGEKGQGSGNKVDQISNQHVIGTDGQPIPIYPNKPNGPYATQEFPFAPTTHGFPDIVDNYAGNATPFSLRNGATLYQVPGDLNGTTGRFEWIIDSNLGGTTHRMFVPGGTINGIPVKP